MLNRSGIVVTRNTPARRMAVSKTASDPAMAPVCDAAARLHVQHDAARVWIVAEVVDEICEIDVEHGADTDEAGKADVALARPIENRGADGAALAQERDAPRSCHRRS